MLFVTHYTSRRSGGGKVRIPRRLPDLQAGRESRVFDFSTPRLFHGLGLLLGYPSAIWITITGSRIYPAMELDKYGARPGINLFSIPFPRYTTNGQPGCFQDGRLARLRPCPRMDVVGYHVAVVGELSITVCAFAVLGDNLPVEELPHLAVGAKFPVSCTDLACKWPPHLQNRSKHRT